MVLVIGFAAPASTYGASAEDFIDRVRGKLRVTSSIYLEAVSRRVDTPARDAPDTAQLILAYRYPDRFLQRVSGRRDRRQVLIVRGDSLVLSYPHLDHVVRRTLTPDRRRELLARHVPLAGAYVGIQSDALPREAISVREDGPDWVVRVENPGGRYDFRSITARFRARDLRPKSFIIRGARRFDVRVTRYVEEGRFPLWVERMFETLDPTVRESSDDD